MEGSVTGRGRKDPSRAGGRKTRRYARNTKADKTAEDSGSTATKDAIDRTDTYKAVYREWLRGMDVALIAEKHGMTTRRVEQIADDLRAVGYAERTEGPMAGLRAIDRMLAQLEHAVGEIADIQQKALDAGNLPVALGATRRKAEARRELLQLLQARGLVPHNLGLLAHQADGVALVQRVNLVLDRYGVGEEVRDAITDLVELDLTPDGRLELMPGTGGMEVVDAEVVA